MVDILTDVVGEEEIVATKLETSQLDTKDTENEKDKEPELKTVENTPSPAEVVEKDMEQMDKEQDELDRFVISSIIKGYELGQREVDFLQKKQQKVDELKARVLDAYDSANRVENSELEVAQKDKIGAKRLSILATDVDAKRSIAHQLLVHEGTRDVYYISKDSPLILREAIAVMDNPDDIVGFEVTPQQTEDMSHLVTLVQKTPDGTLTTRDIITTKEDRSDSLIVFAAEGDIAGHAKRANEVAKAAVKLGYGDNVYWVASGKYAEVEDDYQDSIHHVNLHDELPGHANEAIINALEGHGNMHIWDSQKVQKRLTEYRAAFQDVVANAGEKNVVLVSDFAPVADIAWRELQQQLGREHDKVMSETHDVSMPPQRTIRTFKLFGAPLGEMAHKLTQTRLAKTIDPHRHGYRATNAVVNKAVDTYLGDPLYKVRQELGIDPDRGRSFRAEMHGHDGSITFGLDQNEGWNVGLLAEGKNQVHAPVLINNILASSHDKPIIYHNQGSTYDRSAFYSTASILAGMPDVFSINATGSKTDIEQFAEKGLTIGQDNERFMTLGYAPGYDIVRDTKPALVINQGGWGTISQSIQATTDRWSSTSASILSEARSKQPDMDKINSLIRENAGTLRMISIPRTWEQENNARVMQEHGASCEVFLPSDLKSAKGRQEYKAAIRDALETPVSDRELEFWQGMYEDANSSSPALHAAMILERQALLA